jgi:HTH-type transcriptional regulator, glycine betaine synthesis regulator
MERATGVHGRESGSGGGARRGATASGAALALDAVVDRLAERVGELIRFWGFGPHAGRVWTVLYLSPRPLAAPELAARLGLSAGSVSQTLSLLERWGVVRRYRAPGRKLLLCAGTGDVWRSVMRVLGEREARMVREASALFAELLAEVGRARAAGADPVRAGHVEVRLRAMLRLSRAAEAMLAALLAAGTLDLSPLRRLMRLVPHGKE